jgi:hypothetical protein
MLLLIIFTLISIGFWLYATKIDKNFIPDMQNNLTKYINDIMKKVTPASDSMFDNNTTLMKMNLYLLAFNKNLELYNKLYNSNELLFLGSDNKTVNLEFSDISNLIPTELPISGDILKSKLEISFKNSLGFSKFFIDLCDKGVYLTDYSNMFIDLLKPILIVKSLKFTPEQKVNKLNIVNPSFNHTINNLNTINVNINYMIEIIYDIILILSNITIEYKNIIDLNDQMYMMTNEDYLSKKADVIDKINNYKTQFNTYLNNTGFEYSYLKDYIITGMSFTIENFILMQELTNYIIIYKMLKNINTFVAYDSYVSSSILPYLNNLNL